MKVIRVYQSLAAILTTYMSDGYKAGENES